MKEHPELFDFDSKQDPAHKDEELEKKWMKAENDRTKLFIEEQER